MKLSLASNYALHALVHLAAAKENLLVASYQVAQAQGIPGKFLANVFHRLVAARVLHSVTGLHGGYRLARPASQITLLEVVEAVDGPIRAEVPAAVTAAVGVELDDHLAGVCDRAAEMVRKQLRMVRLADLAG
jgi:Rrf2 family protein